MSVFFFDANSLDKFNFAPLRGDDEGDYDSLA